ncbi:MAG TPA: hypothetical protein EYP69_05225 [Bacteroidales bacterium]|nr:hypothetical protein [Bacteroidales bacterium]
MKILHFFIIPILFFSITEDSLSFASESENFILIENNLTETQKNAQTTEEVGEEKYEEANFVEIQKIGESADFIEASSYCGNSQIEVPEQCDTHNFSGKTCSSFGYDKGSLLCENNCQVISTKNCQNNPSSTPAPTTTPSPTTSTYTGGGGGGYIAPIPTAIPTKHPTDSLIISETSTPIATPSPTDPIPSTTPVSSNIPIATIVPSSTSKPKHSPATVHTPQKIPIKTPQPKQNNLVEVFHNTSNPNININTNATLQTEAKIKNTISNIALEPKIFHNIGLCQNTNTESQHVSETKLNNTSKQINSTKIPDANILKNKYRHYLENIPDWAYILIAFILGCSTRFIGKSNKEYELNKRLDEYSKNLKNQL